MKILTVTTLYPNAAMPTHGVFVENRLRQLLGIGGIEARVIAPVPWFPFSHPRFGARARFAAAPDAETRHGIDILHPRYMLLPKIGMNMAPHSLLGAFLRGAEIWQQRGYDFDLIDAHYFYPDGVAAAWLGRRLHKPVVITARGSDLNLLPEYPRPARLIREAAASAAGIITVSAALARRAEEIGIRHPRLQVLRNGVDTTLFRPRDAGDVRMRFAITGPLIVSVGNLVENKGHDLVIEALRDLPADTRLLIAGDGPEERRLRDLTRRLGLEKRVIFTGRLPHEELPAIYSAADALVLASSREGWPNVLLEAMACGAPAVATDVGGVGEIITAPAAGRIVQTRTAAAIAAAIRDLFATPPERAATRAHAEKFDWEATSRGQMALFRDILTTA